MKTFVIAEAGSTHDGDLQKAIRLVYAAKDCGADAVKFQWVSSPERLAQRRNAGEYVKHYKLISFDRKWFDVLKAEADKRGLEFMCTAYLPEDIAVIAPYVKRFKVASFESEDHLFIMQHGPWLAGLNGLPAQKEIIISCGMGSPRIAPVTGVARYLYCVSAYPCPPDQLNLASMTKRGLDGLSDHTTSALTGALAVAAGATIIEKHIRLMSTDKANADYEHSLVADAAPECAFFGYVAMIREAERAMGDGVKRMQKCEEAMMKFKVKA